MGHGGDTGLAAWAMAHHFGWVGHNAFGPTNNWPVCFVNSQKN